MEIRRLEIRNFGKIHNKTLELSPGINVLYGENESGKTTVHTFVKSMLYGMHRSRGRGAKTDDYSKYEPWENPADYGGTLWFESGGKKFRITRSFSREYASEELFCEDDGEVLDIDEGDLDMLLGGVSETIYENTVSIAQLKSVTGHELVQELQNYMASYQGTGDASVDLGRTAQMLKMTRKGYQTQEERAMKKREEEIGRIRTNIEYVYQEIDGLKSRADAQNLKLLEEDVSGVSEKKAIEEYQEELLSQQKTAERGMMLTGIAAIGFAVAFALLFPSLMAVCLIPILIGAAALYLEYQYKNKLKYAMEKSRRMLIKNKKKEEKRGYDRRNIEQQIEEKEMNLQNLQAELREYEHDSLKPSAAGREIEAINLAMDTMDMLTHMFRAQVGARLRNRTSRILSEITEGKYSDLLIDADFHLRVSSENRIIPIENLSRGTLEQIYFALRMAAGDLLCGDELLPVILDDVFGMYDEERLTAVLHWLSRDPRQVIISTCNRREIELLEREQIPYTLIG